MSCNPRARGFRASVQALWMLDRRRIVVRLAASVALVILALTVGRVLLHDPHDVRLAGDEASYIYNALSLQGGNLSYDQHDHERWLALGWTDQAGGLFVQANDHGWAVAKPLGYSVILAPGLWLFGLRGVVITGAGLMMAYAACWYAAARLRWSVETAVLVAVTATVGSYAWFYAFVAHADLFLAVVVGIVANGCLRAAMRGSVRWFWISMAVAGILATEKVAALFALVPILVISARRIGWQHRLVGGGLLVATAVASMAPYLYYSDGASWSAYGGERYYAADATPWSGGTADMLTPLTTDEVITVSFALDHLRSPSPDLPEATLTYLVGRHTGVLTFLPIVPALVATSVTSLVRRRGQQSVDPSPPDDHECAFSDRVDYGDEAGSPIPSLAWAGVGSLVLYAGFYLLLFTNNYYGGGQSIGSRYFLQFSTAAVVVPVAANLRERVIHVCAALASVWALVVLGPHLLNADTAFVDLWRTSTVQRLLPYDGTQNYREQWPP